jgi:hypothetical protein
MLLTFVLALQAEVDLGGIVYKPPAGWKLDSASGLWVPPDDKPDCFFTWKGPLEATADPPERQLPALQKQLEKDHEVERAIDPTPFASASGVPGAGAGRRLKSRANGGLIYTFEAFLLCEGRGYFFLFATESQETYQKRFEQIVRPTLESVRAAVRELRRCFASLRLPAGWTEEEDQPPYLFRVKAGTAPVVFELRLGRIDDPRAALESWLVGRFKPLAGGERGEVEGREEKKFTREGLASGGELARLRLFERRPGFLSAKTPAMMDGYLRFGDGLMLFAGTEYERAPADGEEEVRAAFGAFEKLFEGELRAVVTGAKFELPPVQARWMDFLKKKKNFRYSYEGSVQSAGPGGDASFVSARRSNWTFSADDTCELAIENYAGVNGQWIDPTSPLDVKGVFSGSEGSDLRARSSRFEVRGRGEKDLWIVVYHKSGASSFHRFEPDAQGEFGKFKPRGIAIDGKIEGSYSRGKGYAIYEPPK